MTVASYTLMRFPEKLANLISLMGINQSRLSRQTGIAQSAISEMTAGKRRPYLDQGFLIAKAVGVSLDFLADDEADDVPSSPLTDDEQTILTVIRDLGLDRQEVIQAISAVSVKKAQGEPAPAREGKGLAIQDMTESWERREAEKKAAEREAIKKKRKSEAEAGRRKDDVVK